MKPEVLAEVQRALLEGTSLEVMYQKRGSDESKLLRVHPLGLSYQDSNIYLSCVFEGLPKGDIAALPLHRFQSARKPFYDIAHPDNYNIQSAQALRSLIGRKTDSPVKITLQVSQALSERLQENPLTTDQVLRHGSEGWWLMTGSIHLSQGLDLWLMSQGEHLEVLEPAALREQIATSTRRTAKLYANDLVRHGSSRA
ncbi:WYL domain-containing protein [Pseudomonas sp. gcc21]|nr:WYL domain-containing protein [Pseudomonas sp. gcc21]